MNNLAMILSPGTLTEEAHARLSWLEQNSYLNWPVIRMHQGNVRCFALAWRKQEG